MIIIFYHFLAICPKKMTIIVATNFIGLAPGPLEYFIERVIYVMIFKKHVYVSKSYFFVRFEFLNVYTQVNQI